VVIDQPHFHYAVAALMAAGDGCGYLALGDRHRATRHGLWRFLASTRTSGQLPRSPALVVAEMRDLDPDLRDGLQDRRPAERTSSPARRSLPWASDSSTQKRPLTLSLSPLAGQGTQLERVRTPGADASGTRRKPSLARLRGEVLVGAFDLGAQRINVLAYSAARRFATERYFLDAPLIYGRKCE